MRRSVKYAKTGEKQAKDMILEFSTRVVEKAMPERPDYATAIRLSEALQDICYALEACRIAGKAGKRLSYVLELHICPDTVSHQLTRDGEAAPEPLPYLLVQSAATALQTIIKLAHAYTLCLHGRHGQFACMDGMRRCAY